MGYSTIRVIQTLEDTFQAYGIWNMGKEMHHVFGNDRISFPVEWSTRTKKTWAPDPYDGRHCVA